MSKINLPSIAKNIGMAMQKHKPEILTGIGLAGMITTTVMAVKATPKALDLMAEVKEKHEHEEDRTEFAKDVFTKVAPVYIPSVILGAASIACIIGASTVNYRRNAALATAFSLSESALKEYQDKVTETIGEKKERVVRDAVAKDQVERVPVGATEVIVTGKGNTLFFDPLSSRVFTSDIETIKKAQNELNRRMLSENYISLNEFYYEIGLSGNEVGEILGWNVERGYIDLDLGSATVFDNKPCIVVAHDRRPDYRYNY
jgi:hypothetical protein